MLFMAMCATLPFYLHVFPLDPLKAGFDIDEETLTQFVLGLGIDSDGRIDGAEVLQV